jgi:hypothetical protein
MKLNQTQRNYIITELKRQVEKKLKAQGIKLTPAFFKSDTIFTLHIFSDGYNNLGRLQVSIDLDYRYKWARGNVCEVKTQLRKDLVKNIQIPSSWYEEQFDAGNVYLEMPEMVGCGDSMGAPRVKVYWPGEDKELARLRRKAYKKVDAAIQEAVEGWQEMVTLGKDAERYLQAAQKKVMLVGQDDAADLLDELSEKANKIFS